MTTPYRPTAERVEGVVIELLDVTDEVREQRARARLDRQNERLVRANEELTRTIVDLRSSNEVMLFSSEDAQSAREEVQTLNEEMQATNEELETLNEELTASVEELTAANEDLAKQSEALASEHRGSEERRSRLEAILASQGDAVLAVDQEGRAVLTNGAYERMFGPADATFEPMDAAGLPLPPDAWPQVRAAAGERFRMRFTLSGPDGSRRWFDAVAEPLTAADSEWVGVLTIRDETERTVVTLLEEVLAAASHELRTPVAALNGYVQLVARQLDRGNMEPAVEYSARATVQAGRLGDRVEQLFDVSRIRSGRLELSRKETDLVTLVSRAVEVAEGLPGAPTIALEAKPAKISMRVDPGRIEQILVILLANAIEHAPAGKGIDVKVSLLPDAVDVAVCDTGPGIAPADVARLFQPFARLGATGRRGAAGLGLGLYIARQIALAHGGEIVADSAPGKGSTFHLRLPFESATGRASRSRSTQVGK